MKKLIIILMLLPITGCLTTGGKASLIKPDGTEYQVSQRNLALAGGKAEAAGQQFSATYKLGDGTDVTVKMGNNVEAPSTPDTFGQTVKLLGIIAPLIASNPALAGQIFGNLQENAVE